MNRALVVIDVQNEYVTGRLPIAYPPVEEGLANIGRVMDGARAHGVPVLVTQDTGPADDPIFAEGSDGWRLHEVVASRPYDHLVRKSLPGAFTGNDLELWLRMHGIDTVALVGFMTHHCIDTSARQATHAGFTAEFIADATGTLALANERGKVSAEQLYQTVLTVMHSRFAAVTGTDEWLRALDSGAPLPRGSMLDSIA